MSNAAAPDYLLKADRSDTTPEMRFGLLLPIWDALWDKSKDKEAHKAWVNITELRPGDSKRMEAIHRRLQAVRNSVPEDELLIVDAQAIAPFTTGLGNEHPLENGFSFLHPYGLPYLPGSGVKGAVRRAAEELAGIAPGIEWEVDSAWTKEAVVALFGPAEGDLQRGALSFWDVLPQIQGNRLMVEIMTPHQGHYYQDGDTPHDSGQPVPISFLTVPPGSGFTFHVVCDFARLSHAAPDLARDDLWKALLSEAFEHAFDWCGFGAKTAVGYGAMSRDHASEQRRAQAHQQQLEQQRRELELEQALSGLPEDAKALIRQIEDENWQADNNALLAGMEGFLAAHATPSPQAREKLEEIIEKSWPGILADPEAKQGRRQKPKYKPRPKDLAIRLRALKQ